MSLVLHDDIMLCLKFDMPCDVFLLQNSRSLAIEL